MSFETDSKTEGMSEEPASAVHLRSDELDHLLELDEVIQ
jgi:hypothetical protein